MSWTTTYTTREEIYRAVWEEPVETVAKRFGLSDVGLAKLCRRHNVPTPPRGYWARRAVGNRDQTPPLPVDHTGQTTVAISKWTASQTAGVPADVERLLEAERGEGAQIVVTRKHRLTNRALLAARDALRGAKPNERGIVRTSKYAPHVDIRVAPASIARALAIVDTWLGACASRGFPVKVTSEAKPQVQVLGTWFSLRVFERSVRVAHPTPVQIAKAKRLRPWDSNPHVFEPTGSLSMGLVEQTWDIHEWRDKKNAPIEEQLNETIAEMIRRGQYRRDQAAERERREAHRAVAERMHGRQQARVKQFQGTATAFQELRRLEDLIEAVARETGTSPDPKVNRWLRWARLITARDNPVKSLLEKLTKDDSNTMENAFD